MALLWKKFSDNLILHLVYNFRYIRSGSASKLKVGSGFGTASIQCRLTTLITWQSEYKDQYQYRGSFKSISYLVPQMRVPSRPRTASLASRGSSISTNAKPANHKKEIISAQVRTKIGSERCSTVTKKIVVRGKQTYNRHNSGNLLNFVINIIRETQNQSCDARVELKTDDRFKQMYIGSGPASIWLSLSLDQEAQTLPKK
jgi:hypothetical protein